MNEISIDITKLSIKPYNCTYYCPRTLLSKSNCIGYCQMGNNDVKYCKGSYCEEYEKKEDFE